MTIEKEVYCNFWGTIVTKAPLKLNRDGFIQVSGRDGGRIALKGEALQRAKNFTRRK